jgi:hypothetical protein
MAFALVGCAHKKPVHAGPVLFKHCAFIQDVDGTRGCTCPNPLVIEKRDAITNKVVKVAYCDGKVNP